MPAGLRHRTARRARRTSCARWLALALLAALPALALANAPSTQASTAPPAQVDTAPPAQAGTAPPAQAGTAPPARGDAARGRAIVTTRQKGLCLLCHSGPFPEERFQGNLAPSLAGTGRRWNAAALRERLTDSRRLNPDSIMASYGSTQGLVQVAPAFRDQPILTEAEIEDVVAFLLTLTADE